MVFSKMGFTGTLYECKEEGIAWCGLYAAGEAGGYESRISAQDALSDSGLCASFLWMQKRPEFAKEEDEKAFLAQIAQILKINYAKRALFWITSQDEPSRACSLCVLTADGTATSSDSSFALEAGLSLLVKASACICLTQEEDGLAIGTEGYHTAGFSGRHSPSGAGDVDVLRVLFSGDMAGLVTYTHKISRSVLSDGLHAGFQIVMPATDQSGGMRYTAQWYPFLASGKEKQEDSFFCQVRPLDLKGTVDYGSYIVRSAFFFQEADAALETCFLTPEGEAAVMTPAAWEAGAQWEPAGFVPEAGLDEKQTATKRQPFVFSPTGDYFAQPQDGQDRYEIMCGLNGVEKIVLPADAESGERSALRFAPGKDGFVPVFPLKEADPLGPPQSSLDSLMDGTFPMSWASARGFGSAQEPYYVAQAERARLFGQDADSQEESSGLLLPKEPGGIVLADACFPMLPYKEAQAEGEAGTLDAGQVLELERTVLEPVRSRRISQSVDGRQDGLRCFRAERLCAADGSDEVQTVVTPSGVLADIDTQSGRWKQIRLGQCQGTDGILEFGFYNPDTALQLAFSSAQMCLVIADSRHLPDGDFANKAGAGGWEFETSPGRDSHYADYASVVIVKSCRGALLDLMKNPANWTMPEAFAPDGQLTALSNWIVDYMEKSGSKDLYEDFYKLVTDESWCGVLVLKAAVTGLPASLGGLMAGLERADFYAHHFAMQFCHIDAQTMEQSGCSAFSGLIDYTDKAYDPSRGEVPVSSGSGDYDFRVLRLVSQFSCSVLKRFYSLLQLDLGVCFGSSVKAVEGSSEGSHALLLRGSYQSHGGAAAYCLDIAGETKADTLLFENEILHSMRVTGARMDMQQDTGKVSGARMGMKQDAGQSLDCRIVLDGALSFACLDHEKEGETESFDLYSYGEPGGLAFTGLGIRIAQTADGRSFSFETDQMSFLSKPKDAREKSLVRQFSMKAQGIVCGGDKLPKDMGYLTVHCDARLSSLKESEWYGIRYTLGMGSSGALSSGSRLKGECLLAWGTGAGSKSGFFGIKLPGTSGGEDSMRIESILKLSVGSLRLVKDSGQDAFVLFMTDIALKFLEIVSLPPEGSTCLYLFADPDCGEKESEPGWYAAYNREDK